MLALPAAAIVEVLVMLFLFRIVVWAVEEIVHLSKGEVLGMWLAEVKNRLVLLWGLD